MPITAFYAGILSFCFVALSLRVIGKRREGIGLGDGGDLEMTRRIRAHGNFAEYVPLALVLIGLLEAGGAPAAWLHGLGAALLVGRLLHGWAFAFAESFPIGRVGGTALTLGTLLVGGALCVGRAVGAL